jgi:hypothetical protein
MNYLKISLFKDLKIQYKMVNKKIVNERCPVRDRMSVEQGKPFCISRELPMVFQVSDSASREPLGGNDFLPTFRLYETIIIKSLNFEIFKLKNVNGQ